MTDVGCCGRGNTNATDDDGDGAVDEDPPNGIDDDGDCTANGNGDGNICAWGDVGADETGFNDWDNIRFDFRHRGNFADGVANPARDEPDPEATERSKRRLPQRLRPQLIVAKTTPGDRVAIGETLVYTVRMRVTETLPDGYRRTEAGRGAADRGGPAEAGRGPGGGPRGCPRGARSRRARRRATPTGSS